MDRIEKFRGKANAALRARMDDALRKILANDLQYLDIKPLTGQDDLFRCRIGKVRIIFQRTKAGNVVIDIGFRGHIYKRKN